MAKGVMEDEYGAMSDAGLTYTFPGRFSLENGRSLLNPQVRYNTWGQLNEAKDNVLVVCHALTGNSDVASWWGGLLGDGRAFDTSRFLVVGANILGSCYGSTGPQSVNPETGQRYGHTFPAVTVRDTVRLHIKMVTDAIGANCVRAVVGGSFGGMQALEWALLGKGLVGACVAIGCGAAHTAWQIGISELQRQAIYRDAKWKGGEYKDGEAPLAGLSLARQIAMVSYRTHTAFQQKFGRDVVAKGRDALCTEPSWQVRQYLDYQGEKFLSRFDPLTYVRMTEQMDTHDVGRGRGGVEAALAQLTQPALVIGIDSDVLYPLSEQQELHAKLPNSELFVVRSDDGHDGFLLAQEQVSAAISRFLSAGRERARL